VLLVLWVFCEYRSIVREMIAVRDRKKNDGTRKSRPQFQSGSQPTPHTKANPLEGFYESKYRDEWVDFRDGDLIFFIALSLKVEIITPISIYTNATLITTSHAQSYPISSSKRPRNPRMYSYDIPYPYYAAKEGIQIPRRWP